MIDEKKLLKHLSDWWLSETPRGDGTILFINGEPQKTPMMKAIEDFMKTVERMPKVGEWIPCRERLPVPNEYDETGKFFKAYLVQTKRNRMHTALWDGTYWTIWTRGIVIDKVIAWMPLPPAYKEGE